MYEESKTYGSFTCEKFATAASQMVTAIREHTVSSTIPRLVTIRLSNRSDPYRLRPIPTRNRQKNRCERKLANMSGIPTSHDTHRTLRSHGSIGRTLAFQKRAVTANAVHTAQGIRTVTTVSKSICVKSDNFTNLCSSEDIAEGTVFTTGSDNPRTGHGRASVNAGHRGIAAQGSSSDRQKYASRQTAY